MLVVASDTVEAGFPRVLAIAWGMDQAPQRGPKRELTHETIVDAAITLADDGGLAAVTMQRVAEALGFSAMALYRYVASKDELIMLMQDRAMNVDGAWPVEADDWRTGLTDVAAMLRSSFQRHPWTLDVAMSATTAVMPNSVRYTDAVFRAMRRLPVPAAERGVVVLAVTLLVRSYCTLERDLAAAGSVDGPAVAEFTPGIVALLREVVTPAQFPDLAPVAVTFYTGDASNLDDFTFVFGRFLDGLEAHARSRPLPPPTPPATPTPTEALALAEHEVATLVAQRKEAERRLKDLQRRVGQAERERDRAKQRLK